MEMNQLAPTSLIEWNGEGRMTAHDTKQTFKFKGG